MNLPFFLYLLGAQSAMVVSLALLFLLLAFGGAMMGGSTKTTVTTYRGGRAISSYSYTTSDSEKFFSDLADVFSCGLPKFVTTTLTLSFFGHIIAGLILIFSITSHWEAISGFSGNWKLSLVLCLLGLILNAVLSFAICITSMRSWFLTLLVVIGKSAIFFFTAYRVVVHNLDIDDLFHFIRVSLLSDIYQGNLSVCDERLYLPFLLGLFLLLALLLLFPLRPKKRGIKPDIIPRSYFIQFSSIQDSEIWSPLIIFALIVLFLVSLIGCIATKAIRTGFSTPYSIFWFVHFCLCTALLLKKIIYFFCTL